MHIRRVVPAAVAAVALTFAMSVPAHAGTDTLSVGSDTFVVTDGQVSPAAQTQRFSFTVSVVDDAVAYLSYRETATHSPNLDSECGATLAQDKGHLVIKAASKLTGPVSATVTVAFGTYVFCKYRDYLGIGTPEAALIAGASSAGTFIPGYHPGVGKINSINLYASHLTKTVYYVYGATNGPRTGTVRIQRKTATGWQTLAVVHLVKGAYLTHLTVHRGDRLRAYYLGDRVWRQDLSDVVLVR